MTSSSDPPASDDDVRAAHIAAMVDKAPPLTPEQIDQLAPIWTAAARRAAEQQQQPRGAA